jgi:hypothetical protein
MMTLKKVATYLAECFCNVPEGRNGNGPISFYFPLQIGVVCLFSWRYNPLCLYFPQPGSGLYSPRFRGFLITHNDALQSVGLLWASDQSVAETST